MQTLYMTCRHMQMWVLSLVLWLFPPILGDHSQLPSMPPYPHHQTAPMARRLYKKNATRWREKIIILSDRVQQTNAARTCSDIYTVYIYVWHATSCPGVRGGRLYMKKRGCLMARQWQRWLRTPTPSPSPILMPSLTHRELVLFMA